MVDIAMDRLSTMRIVLALAGLLVAGPGYAAAPNLPDHARTPGASDPDITQGNYREMLCRGADEKRRALNFPQCPNLNLPPS